MTKPNSIATIGIVAVSSFFNESHPHPHPLAKVKVKRKVRVKKSVKAPTPEKFFHEWSPN